METYEKWNIQELPLSTPYFRCQVERFLEANGLRMEALDAYFAVQDAQGHLLAGAGLQGDILKCVAVAASFRSEGLMVPLVSHVISVAASRGILNLKVFTKPEHQAVFESLGFRLLAAAPEAILLENGRGLERYCAYLRTLRRPGRSGVIVMNANPFTLGHKYLMEKALEQVDTLFVIPVKEDVSLFPYAERLAMIRAASGGAVVVAEGSAYCISAATFPTYFLKDPSAAAQTQMQLDLDLYARWIAPALDASVRFVGSEPFDALTNHYNQLIPNAVVIPRLQEASAGPAAEGNNFLCSSSKNQFPSANTNPTHAEAEAVSATAVRKCLAEGTFRAAAALCPATTWPYLLAVLADRALRLELDTPMKPGLVGPDGPGAHKDMDYDKMLRGIDAIRPFWPRMALAASIEELRRLGIDAEEAMLAATGGVNTHRGAIFALGLTVYAWTQGARDERIMRSSLGEIARGVYAKSQIVNKLHPRAAMANALSGYAALFEDWLPLYRHLRHPSGPGAEAAEGEPAAVAEQMLLLRIMSMLEDSCVIKRVGEERAQTVKEEARALFEEMAGQAGHDEGGHDGKRQNGEDPAGRPTSPALSRQLQEMCARYAAEGISPGGAADMLALTIFIDSILS